MKQILMLHIGQCGVQMGNSCWQLFCHEHGISESGLKSNQSQNGNLDVLFSQASSGKFTPRAVHIDLEPNVIDEVKKSKYNQLYNPSSMIAGKEDAANNYIRGHYTLGKQVCEPAQDRIRKQIEKADCLEGIITTHSINGGTGSGLNSLLMERMSVSFPKIEKINLLVYPSAKMCDTAVESYNAVLSGHSLLQYSSISIPIANQRMYQITQQQLDIQAPTFGNINHLAAMKASNLTAGARFPAQNSWSIRDLTTNLVPYPRIHFAASSFSNFNASANARYERQNVGEVTRQVFNLNNSCVDIGTYNPRFISNILMYRSQNPVYSEAVLEANSVKNSSSVKFVNWLPINLKLGASTFPLSQLKYDGHYETIPLSCNMLSINNRIDHIFARVNLKFDRLYAKRAFVHWYVWGGTEEGLFSEARESLAALERDFQEGSDLQQFGQHTDE